MNATFTKLNLKDQREILVLNAPTSFEPTLATLADVTIWRSGLDSQAISFVLAFVTTQQEVDTVATEVVAKTQGDAVVWFAYPKGSSKRYTCDFNRDTGWELLGKLGFEPVRQVAIDEDWSALRFRRVEFIKSMTRQQQRALTEQGKTRTTQD